MYDSITWIRKARRVLLGCNLEKGQEFVALLYQDWAYLTISLSNYKLEI